MTVFMGLPIISIALFLVAGIAIGYLVWYRDRTDDDIRILDLEERYAAANGAAETHRQEFVEAKKALTIQGSDLEQLRAMKLDVEEATELLRAKLDAETSRNESLALQLEEAVAGCRSSEDLQSRNQKVIREAGDELGRQTAIMEKQADEIEELKRQLEIVSDESHAEKLLAQLREENSALQSRIDEGTSAIESKQKQIVELTSQTDTLTSETSELRTQTEELKVELENFKAQAEDYKSQIGSLSQKDYPATINLLRQQLAESSKQTEQAESQNDVLNGVVTEKETRIVELEAALTKQNDIIQQGSPTEAMKAEYDRMSQQFQSATSKNSDMRVTLGEQAKQIALLLKEQDAVKALREENTELANRLGAAETKNEELNTTLAAKLKEFTESTAGFRSTMDTKDKEIEQLQKTEEQLKHLKAELDNAARLVKTANDENARVNNLVSERQAEIADLKNQLAEVNKLRAELAESTQTIEKQQGTHRELRTYNEKQAAEIGRLNKELQETLVLEKQLSQSAADLQQMRAQSEQQTKAFAEQRQELQLLKANMAEYEATKKQLEDATTKVSSAQAERQRLAETRLDLEKQIKKLSTQVSVQSNDADDLRRQLETKTKAYEKAITDSQQFAASLKQQESAISSLEKKLRNAQTLQPENERLQSKVTELMAALKDLSNEHESSLAANAKAQASIRDLQNEVHENTKTIRELRRPRGGGIFQFGQDDQQDRRAA